MPEGLRPGTDRPLHRADGAGEGYATALPGVFAAGDMRRGQVPLWVWAIREGQEAAREIDGFLMGFSG